MLAGLRTIRAASAHKGVAMLVVVVQQGLPRSELPHDRVAGICSSLELEHRCAVRAWLVWCLQQPQQLGRRPLMPPPPPLLLLLLLPLMQALDSHQPAAG